MELRELHILLVEDNPGDRDLIVEISEDCQSVALRFSFAERLSAALDLLARDQPDLILLDPGLPDCVGLESVRRICAAAPQVPVVVLTGNADSSMGLEAIRIGAQDYLFKGHVSADILERVVRYALERHAGKQEVRTSEQFLRATLDAMEAQVAILDEQGMILNCNRSWQQQVLQDPEAPDDLRIGGNYLRYCRENRGGAVTPLEQVGKAIGEIIAGSLPSLSIEYSLGGGRQEQWLHTRVTPFSPDDRSRVVVVHEDTTRLQRERARRQQSETVFKQVFLQVPVGLWLTDAAGAVIEANPAALKIQGGDGPASARGLAGCTFRRLGQGGDTFPAGELLGQVLEHGMQVADQLMEFRTGDGDVRRVNLSATPVTDEGGSNTNALISALDMSERLRAEQNLRESEERLRGVFNTSPNAVTIKDRQGRYLMANRAAAALFGKRQSDMLGLTDLELAAEGLIDPEDAERIGSDDRLAMESRRKKTNHEESIRFRGDRRYFYTVRNLIGFPDQPDCLLTIATDITEVVDARFRCRNAELRLQAILDALESSIFLLDRGRRVVWANRSALSGAAVELHDAIGHPCHEVFDRGAEVCADCAVADSILSGATEVKISRDARGRSFRIMAIPARDGMGQVANTVVVVEEITERLALEQQLRQAQKMESLGTLAGGIAHDFNNILSGIMGFTELTLMRDIPDSMTREYLQEVHDASLRATDLVRQILTFSRQVEHEPKPLMVQLVVKEALKLLRSTLPTSIKIVSHIEKDTRPVLADPTHVHQVVMNLCTNAMHAMEPYGGTLTVRLEEVEVTGESHPDAGLAPGAYLRLQIADTGAGIDPGNLEKIFDPYYTTKDLGVGTGLGLAVVHGIIEDCDGAILVDSTPGEGTAFTILLPTVAHDLKEPDEDPGFSLPRGSEHILVVDDEPFILKLCRSILERQGYRVTTELQSRQALEMIRRQPDAYDLVLSDVVMPQLTGDLLAREILHIAPHMAVVLMTGYAERLRQEELLAAGIRSLLQKPVARKTLVREVRAALDRPGGA